MPDDSEVLHHQLGGLPGFDGVEAAARSRLPSPFGRYSNRTAGMSPVSKTLGKVTSSLS